MTDRERLIDILSKHIYPREGVDQAEVVADYLLDQGVRPVVRCKDCMSLERKNGYCICEYLSAAVLDNWFCWAGERRTDGTEID